MTATLPEVAHTLGGTLHGEVIVLPGCHVYLGIKAWKVNRGGVVTALAPWTASADEVAAAVAAVVGVAS